MSLPVAHPVVVQWATPRFELYRLAWSIHDHLYKSFSHRARVIVSSEAAPWRRPRRRRAIPQRISTLRIRAGVHPVAAAIAAID
jgi:hypothetical protein